MSWRTRLAWVAATGSRREASERVCSRCGLGGWRVCVAGGLSPTTWDITRVIVFSLLRLQPSGPGEINRGRVDGEVGSMGPARETCGLPP